VAPLHSWLLYNLVEDALRDMKTRLLQATDRRLEIDQSMLRSRSQDAQRAGKRQMPPLGLLPAGILIDDELVGVEFFGQQNRIAFARV